MTDWGRIWNVDDLLGSSKRELHLLMNEAENFQGEQWFSRDIWNDWFAPFALAQKKLDDVIL